MSYFPPDFLQDTVLPRAYDRDLQFQLRTISERWRRFYPEVQYFSLLKRTTAVYPPVAIAVSQDPVNLITGEAGTTRFDDLYREHVPATVTPVTGWQQPHNDPAHNASEEEVFDIAKPLHVRFFREAKQTQITKWGFDKFRDVILTIPLILLDEIGVVAKEGDKFLYERESYLVSEANTTGYWKNSNLSLYAVLNCVHKRRGA